MKTFRITLLMFLSVFLLLPAFSQRIHYKGVVRDITTNATIAGVNILVKGTSTGTVSDINGTFTLAIENPRIATLILSHVSYQNFELGNLPAERSNESLGNIFLEPAEIGLKEIRVISSYLTETRTPVPVSFVSAQTIERFSGNNDFPENMKMVPGVYATKQGGGNGDDRLTIRGFQQENIALLLNGVPVSSMENGLVYWSNWVGLADATESIQVQRGLGASKVAMNSVDGTVNIITKTTSATKGGTIRYSVSDYGNQKTILNLNTGLLKNGYAVTFLGSRSTGPGYVDGTYVDGWAYFLSVSKTINSNHKLVFTALGSPERHGQRNYGMTPDDFEKYGAKYNPSWGVYKGKILNLSENFYHKPQINLNHYWNISSKSLLATSAYVSFGYGGGRYAEAYNYGVPVWYFRKNNQVDFDAIYNHNLDNTDTAILADGSGVSGFSRNILTHYRANHYWAGVLSKYNLDITPHLKLTAGVHARTFRSRLYEEINDLMGGKFWIDTYAWTVDGIAGRNQIKKTGDVINVDNYSLMNYGNLFGQLEYSGKRVSGFIASSLSGTQYQRKDPYNYITDIYSEVVRKAGFDSKGGISFIPVKNHELYANAGFYSREPLFKFVYVNYSNTVARDLRNEKVATTELGYRFLGGRFTSKFNLYLTYWKDKSLFTWENIQLADSSMTRAMVKGLNALHKGIEWEGTALVSGNLTLSSTISIGWWKWENDVNASIYDDRQVLVNTMKIYTKGLIVGDAPQTQVGLLVDYKLLDRFTVAYNCMFYDRLYANFDPADRSNAADRNQPYRLPAYSISDLYLGMEFSVFNQPASFQLSCQNIFDEVALMRAEDGPDHDRVIKSGFWSQGRTFNVSLKVGF